MITTLGWPFIFCTVLLSLFTVTRAYAQYGYAGYNRLIPGIVAAQGNFQRNNVTLGTGFPSQSIVHCAIARSDDDEFGDCWVETGWMKAHNNILNNEYRTYCAWGVHGGGYYKVYYTNDAGADTQMIYRIMQASEGSNQWVVWRMPPSQPLWPPWFSQMRPEYPVGSGQYVWTNKTGDQGIWSGEVLPTTTDMPGTDSDKCNCYDLAIKISQGGVWTGWLDANIQDGYIPNGDKFGLAEGFDINEWGNDYISIREFRIWDKYPLP